LDFLQASDQQDAQGKASMPARLANSIDAYVGSRLRLLRTKQNMTQQGIADRLGISFQQVQKYEKGFNRIGASRLQHLSQIFDVPVDFFFDGAPRLTGSVRKNKQAPSMGYVDDLLAGAEGKALAKAFSQIKDVTVRRSVVHMVEALAQSGNQ
jgi:transcriptional regulator with XRE-family HTH domain